MPEPERKQHRRPDFDDLVAGWGSDSFDNLTARCQLVAEWWKANFPLSIAEIRVTKAMTNRLRALGGLPPTELPN